MIATCGKCGQKNRIPITPKKTRCGKCKVEFSIADLAKAVPEPPPTMPDFDLDMEEDGPLEDEDGAFNVNRLGDQPTLRRLVRPCWPKERHASYQKAQAQLRSILKRGLEKDLNTIHSYLCPHCHGWHVGH